MNSRQISDSEESKNHENNDNGQLYVDMCQGPPMTFCFTECDDSIMLGSILVDKQDVLGCGGSAIVYKGHDTKQKDIAGKMEEVAVKFICPHLGYVETGKIYTVSDVMEEVDKIEVATRHFSGHPNIEQLHDVYLTETKVHNQLSDIQRGVVPYLVYEAGKTDLASII